MAERKQLMATVPMCWKCSNRIMVADPEMEGVAELKGCKENPNIHEYEDAKTMCPLDLHGN